MRDDWYPLGTQTEFRRPAPGRLIAFRHAVWRVVAVVDVPLSDEDREVWLDAGMPDLATWDGRPYRVDADWVAGARPDWAPAGGPVGAAHMDVPAARYRSLTWRMYPASGRWPMCSCCGEPAPCRAEEEDREVTRSLATVERLAKRLPGNCWACEEPISHRQNAVAYPGDNLDLPGGPEVRFHIRRKCRHLAEEYERRWVREDPRRERVLTWPRCAGILVVHGDGSSECRSGRGPLGDHNQGEPDCRGHLTHDHGTHAACFVGDAWMAQPSEMPGCPRGCDPENHPGTRTSPRPERRDTSQQVIA